jgi:predicted molibdopterin-dependent oxidoreductase YjgC
MLKKGNYFREVGWDEAIQAVTSKLEGIKPDEFLMLVSSDLTNESLFAAQKFVRSCLNCNSIDSTARMDLGGGLDFWSWLFSLPISIKNIAKSDAILAIGLDTRFDFSVVGVQIRRALDRGAKLVTIDPRDSNLARYTDHWLQPIAGTEGVVLKSIADALSGKKTNLSAIAQQTSVDADILKQAIEILSSSQDLAVIIGPAEFHYGNIQPLVDALVALSKSKSTVFVPLYFGVNARGALEMGVFPELLPGGKPNKAKGLNLTKLLEGSIRPKVLYLVGEAPFAQRPDCDFIIAQDTYLPPFEVDAFLPAASFAEAEGTLVNVEGRVQELVQVDRLPEGAVTGVMRPDWRIFSDLAQSMKCQSMTYRTSKDVLKEIHKAISGFPSKANRKPRCLPASEFKPHKDSIHQIPMSGGHFLMVAEPAGFRHRGIDIASKVGGLQELALEEGFRLNPDDLEMLGIQSGDIITVSWDNGKATVSHRAISSSECPKGTIYFSQPIAFGGLKHREGLAPLYNLSQNPIRVKITIPKQGGGQAKAISKSRKSRAATRGGKSV